MITKGSVRRKSVEVFRKVIELRKKEYSYTEIRKETGIAKSTINNWLSLAGLTLSKEHLQIQAKKRIENHVIATEASKRTRAKRREEIIQDFVIENRNNLDDPFFVAGVMLYEAEGSKQSNSFSNSDFRLILLYIRFLEKYVLLNRNSDMGFRLYIHETRRKDLQRIKNFWSKKLGINPDIIKVSWKRNIVTKRRFNLDYEGQMSVKVIGVKQFIGKILTISDIILSRYSRV